jgi:hypothetical protein
LHGTVAAVGHTSSKAATIDAAAPIEDLRLLGIVKTEKKPSAVEEGFGFRSVFEDTQESSHGFQPAATSSKSKRGAARTFDVLAFSACIHPLEITERH